MLLHSEYVVTSFKKFKWRDTMYTVRCNKTKQNLDYEMTFFYFTWNGEDPNPSSCTLRG
jgi:hypothetical protein